MQLMKIQQVGEPTAKGKKFTEEERSENIRGKCPTDQEWDSGTETILQEVLIERDFKPCREFLGKLIFGISRVVPRGLEMFL